MSTLKITLHKNRKRKDGKYPIVIRVVHNRKTRYIFTGFKALEKEWNGTFPKFVNTTHPNYEMLNHFLISEHKTINDELIKLKVMKQSFSIDELTNKVRNKGASITFNEYTNEYIKELTRAGRIGTASNYKTVLRVVNSFMKGKQLYFEDINHEWLSKLENNHYSKGYCANGLAVYLRDIRTIFNKAIRESIIDDEYYPFGRNKYSIPKSPTQKRAIDKESVIKIENLEVKENSLIWQAKNYFLFSFYTMGMNWTDMANLKMSNIVNNRIEYIRSKTKRKTSKGFTIKINDKIDKILSFYTKDKKKDDFIFPIIHSKLNPVAKRNRIMDKLKDYNASLKKIAKLCDIEQHLTSYVARHTWATVAKKSGIDIGIISDGLGHNSIEITSTYLDSFGSDAIDEANLIITG